MKQQETIKWLFENGGPVVRYRTATELLPPSSNVDTGRLFNELIHSEQVRTWLERLVPAIGIVGPIATDAVNISLLNELHGSKATTFENVMGKLTDFGLRNGFLEFDQRTIPYRRWLQANAERPPEYIFDVFARTLVAAFLARAGYANEPAIGLTLKRRLDTVYDFVRQGSYDIYVNPEGYRRMPANFRGKPLINPELTKDGNICLPTIYDILGWAAYLPDLGTEDDRAKANAIIRYIFNNEYQKLPHGYGVLLANNGRYYGMGWSVHLPDFDSNLSQGPQRNSFVQLLSILARFPVAIQHRWFINGLRHLEEFKTERDTYLFPRTYLQERPMGYWIGGLRVGLEENRRTNLAFELESTFWIAHLEKMISLSKQIDLNTQL